MPTPLQQTAIPWVLEKDRVRAPGAVLSVAGDVVGAPTLAVPRLRKLPIELLFDAQDIRDVLTHRPLILLDLGLAKLWTFEADNGLNQAVTIAMVGGLANDPAGVGNVGLSQSLAANTREPIISDTWAPYLGVTVLAALAPTTGSITIRGQVQVED